MRRRQFLHRMFAAGTLIYFGCDAEDGISMRLPDADADLPDQGLVDGMLDAGPIDAVPNDAATDAMPDAAPDAMPSDCAELLPGGEFIEQVPFTGGDPIRFHEPRRQGWDGRLYTDLSRVDGDRLVTPTPEYYIRTLFPDGLDLDARMPWQIELSGLIDNPGPLALADLLPSVRDMGTHVMECSGNGRRSHFGLMSAANWRGIPIEAVLDRLQLQPGAARIEIEGVDDHSVPSANNHSTPGASWIFTPEQLIEAGAFLATEMNGEPLPLDHGFPVRLYVPGWYGCCCIKWVDRIRVLPDDAPASSQMQEFAQRTHQVGIPALARDYRPAQMQQAAMPIRVERWRQDGQTVFRVVGILWGGGRPTEALTVDFGDGPEPVDICPAMSGNATWTVWEHVWRPERAGEYQVHCAIDDETVPTIRLDRGYYDRFVSI